jgi:hypothetical protein
MKVEVLDLEEEELAVPKTWQAEKPEHEVSSCQFLHS